MDINIGAPTETVKLLNSFYFANEIYVHINKVTMMTETGKSSLDVDPYACAIKIKHRYFNAYLTVGHIRRAIVFTALKKEES